MNPTHAPSCPVPATYGDKPCTCDFRSQFRECSGCPEGMLLEDPTELETGKCVICQAKSEPFVFTPPAAPQETTSPNGRLTFAHVDGPDDRWAWAIVTEYKGCQEYGEILMAFQDECTPSPARLAVILAALEASL